MQSSFYAIFSHLLNIWVFCVKEKVPLLLILRRPLKFGLLNSLGRKCRQKMGTRWPTIVLQSLRSIHSPFLTIFSQLKNNLCFKVIEKVHFLLLIFIRQKKMPFEHIRLKIVRKSGADGHFWVRNKCTFASYSKKGEENSVLWIH